MQTKTLFIDYYIHKQNRQKIEPKKVIVRNCIIGDIDKVLDLQNIIVENTGNEKIFQITEKEELIEDIYDENEIVGCFLEDYLIAYGVLRVPGIAQENLGYDAGISEDELAAVAHIDTIAVHPLYRGNGLHKYICSLLEERARENGIKYLCATVSPENEVSLKNFLELNYKIIAKKIKYINKDRYIICKTIDIVF